MLAMLRAGMIAALFTLVSLPAIAADKPYHRDELSDQAIRLEAQIKSEAGTVTTPAATLRRQVELALQRSDRRVAVKLLGQVLTLTPNDSAVWLLTAHAYYLLITTSRQERALFLSRAATAAYIAYQRSSKRSEEAESLALLGRTFADRRLWRPALDTLRLALELNDDVAVRAQYEQLRSVHGFRLLDYSVDADAAAPRACFQFSERLPTKRVDFSTFVAVAGIDKPALSAEDRQLCVEGLKHGERYAVTLRAGLPSVVHESLAKSSEFSIYVRDRSPFVRFTGKAYVLPRIGQRGIPLVSVNTKAVKIEIYRIGDRNLLDTVIGRDFQRTFNRYEVDRLAGSRGAKAWTGELAVDAALNAEVTTAFPLDQAVGDLKPGVYVMVAHPKEKLSEPYDSLATQWFIVSDLGLTAFSGGDGIHVFVHSLASAEPKGLIEIRLMARNNEVLAVRRTDASGHAHFEAGLTRGEGGLAPALLVASPARGEPDYAFLSLKSPAFDLSDRGVAGRTVPGALDAFIYTERGVYRSGESVHVTALLRDSKGVAALGVPLTLVFERPDGVEYRRTVVADQGIGGHTLTVPINSAAPGGTWRVAAFTDPKRAPVGETTFLVEDYVPDRIEFDLNAPAGKIAPSTPTEITLEGRYLYGSPAAGLGLEGEVTVRPAKERPGLAGYQFGLSDEEVTADRQPLADLPQTDADGKAAFKVELSKLPATSQPLEARITVRMAEAGGRAVERKLMLPITPTTNMIGVKPLFSGRSLGEGENAGFDVIMVTPDGKQFARKGMHYELVRIESRYQWYRHNGRWDYEPVKLTSRIADGTFDIGDTPARLSLPVEYGRYRLDVSTDDPNGPITSVGFDAGWYSAASADTPDMLEIALDKPAYSAGDTMEIAVTARTAGHVQIDVIGDRLISSTAADAKPGVNKLRVGIGRDWGNGAYVVATLRRPLDAKARRMPGRAIGVHWFSIDRKAHTLALDLRAPSLLRPQSTLRIPVKINGLVGQEARLVVAAVDVGILNLTNYKPPAPEQYYLGQRRLTAEIRDLYGQLIDGMQGTRGQIRTGGDAAGPGFAASPPAQKPLALYSGIVKVAADGTAEVSFDIPAFAGTVRVMAVAWSKNKFGHAVSDVTVRDPVVLTATLPRFLRNGDHGLLRIDLDNVEGAAGDYSVDVKTRGAVNADNVTKTLKLAAKQRDSVQIALAADAAGSGLVEVRVSGPGGYSLARSYALNVNPATQILTRRTVKPIAKGESLTLSADLFADLVPGSGAVAISVGLSTALDAATILRALDRYPYGCSEQIVSRALPLLYVNDLASAAHLAFDTAIDQRIRDAIDLVLSRQSSNGSFGLWSVGGDDAWLDAYVTDFLTRARERGVKVADVAFKLALDRLRNFVGNARDVSKTGGGDLAYALYVLARNGIAPIGDLRYLADAKLGDISTPIAKAQIAAALGMLGDKTRAERAYAAALRSIPAQPRLEFGRDDFGSVLRDAAALVTLASEGDAPRPTVFSAVQRVETARALTPFTSTQENSWLALAARAIAKDADKVSVMVGGKTQTGAFYRTIPANELQSPFKVTNSSEGPLQAVVSVTGAPLTPEPAAERGFKIERLTYDLEGKAVDISKVKQNQRIVVVLKVTEPQPKYGRVIVADYLPAGFEIDNPRLVSSGDTGTLSWITDAVAPVHSEFRDDRFTAAFERRSNNRPVFTVAYIVRAVSPGQYVLPQAYVEDMYRPDRFGRTGTGKVEVTAAK